jgi:transposase
MSKAVVVKQTPKVNPDRKRQTFSKEFKLEAVRLLERGEKPAEQLALELGIRRNMLYKWQKQLAGKGEDQALRGPGAKKLSEYSEIEMLKRELKRVTEERDILKKAAAYFARELS